MSDELNRSDTVEIGPNDPAKKKKKKKKGRGSAAIDEALERLEAHIADPTRVEDDRKQAGRKLRVVTMFFIAFAVLAVFLPIRFGIITEWSHWRDTELIIAGMSAAVFVILAIVLVAVDLSIVPRDKPAPADATLKSYLKSLAMGRSGYGWACLCPTARDTPVKTPELGDVTVTHGEFTLHSPDSLKAYTSSFMRVGNGQIRNLQLKRVSIVETDGDVAVVEVHAVFQSWPQWANMLAVVAFVFIRLLGAILFLVLYLSMRKRYETTFRKTMLRGSNGLWYVYTGDMFEASPGRG